MTVAASWSFRHLMETLVATEAAVATEVKTSLGIGLTIKTFKPTKPQLPTLYHVFGPGSVVEPDLARIRDNIQVFARIATRRTDDQSNYMRLLDIADIYRDVMDPLLFKRPPLDGTTAKWATRTSVRELDEEFSGVHALAVEFPLTFWLDRPSTAIP